MATSQYGVNHPMAKKLWSAKLFTEALKQTWLNKFMGNDSSSIIQIKGETQKSAGDRITVGLRMQLTGNGVIGDSTLEGNEEALTIYTDNVFINQLRHAVRSDGRMSEQRVPFTVREEARKGLVDWWANRIDTSLFNQLAGNSGQSNTVFTGNQAAIAPSTTNIIYADGQATEAAVCSHSASAVMSLKYIDWAVEKAQVLTPMIRPVNVDGDDMYVLFLHPYQVTSLRTSTSTGQWLDIQKAAMAGMQSSKSPIFTGSLGVYNNVVIHASTRIPRTTDASSITATNGEGCYRAVFCGAQAGLMAYGQGSSDQKMEWTEKLFDYGNQLGVSSGMIYGCKKTVFNSQDFGVIVIPTYAISASG